MFNMFSINFVCFLKTYYLCRLFVFSIEIAILVRRVIAKATTLLVEFLSFGPEFANVLQTEVDASGGSANICKA